MTNPLALQPLLVAEYILAGAAFVALFFVNAPYGRFVRRGWGPTLPARWAWFVMETPALLVILVSWLLLRRTAQPAVVALLVMWQIHYLYRVFLYPFLKRGAGKPFPWLLVAFAIVFNSINGYVNGASLSEQQAAEGVAALLRPNFLIGVILFAAGFCLHVMSDAHLRALRKDSDNGYQVPRAGLFRLVSCPHYLGEIVEWCGWALAAWSPAGLAFAVFTVANLAPRAWAHHRWYHATFADYPKSRRALVPWVW